MIRKLGVGLVLAVALLAPAGAVEAAGMTTRVSVASDGSEGNQASGSSDFSLDGRFVAFISYASNLVPGDQNNNTDVFVHDRLSGETTRVSVSSTGQEPSCSPFASAPCSLWPSISADGRFIAFQSNGRGLVAGDLFGSNSVFVHDRDVDMNGIFDEPGAISTEMISVDPQGNPTNGESLRPAISADGRFVAFVSFDLNLVPEDPNGAAPDVFVRDRVLEATERVASSGVPLNRERGGLAISTEGRFVAFTSLASDLVPDDNNGVADVFVRDRNLSTTVRVSVDGGGNEANLGSGDFGVSISGDGRFVAFDSYASNLMPGDTKGHGDIFVRDMLMETTERVSIATAGNEGDSDSFWPSLNSDGRFVTFSSYASNLVPGDAPLSDIFVRDRVTGITRLVSVDSNGQHPDGYSGFSDVSGDGRSYAFGSQAWELVPNDTNLWPDVFIHDLGDTDGDGEWDPFDPCPTSVDHTDSDGDLKPDACDGPGTGNVDCSGPTGIPPTGVSATDALKVLRYVAGLSVSQNEPCLDIGEPRLPPATGIMGDRDCDADVNAVDALKILRAVAGLPVAKPEECPEIKPPP